MLYKKFKWRSCHLLKGTKWRDEDGTIFRLYEKNSSCRRQNKKMLS